MYDRIEFNLTEYVDTVIDDTPMNTPNNTPASTRADTPNNTPASTTQNTPNNTPVSTSINTPNITIASTPTSTKGMVFFSSKVLITPDDVTVTAIITAVPCPNIINHEKKDTAYNLSDDSDLSDTFVKEKSEQRVVGNNTLSNKYSFMSGLTDDDLNDFDDALASDNESCALKKGSSY